MMDVLDKFVTVRDGDVVMRLDKGEAPVLQEYAMSLAHQALNTLAARYEFTPEGPILVEIFPKHDDFAVRNVGLPGLIGALGICFGRVVTMDSPRARPPGEFQWEATLWHELAHVITLQMSNQRMPRWLTEGISVYEEKRARAEWGREMDVAFAGMLNRGETVKLRELNAAFQNPKTISLAYYQASLLVEHLVTAYGEAGLRKLVRIYGQGLDTDAALKAALNTDFDQLQTGFDEAVERQFGAHAQGAGGAGGRGSPPRAPPTSCRRSPSRTRAASRCRWRSAAPSARTARLTRRCRRSSAPRSSCPLAGGKDSAHDQIAAMAIEKKDTARAIAELTALVAVDFNNVEAARLLAALLRETKVEDPAKLRPVYERIAAIDPFDSDAHVQLGRMALRRNEAETAAREFRTVLALGPVDKAAAFTDLAESYFQARQARRGEEADAGRARNRPDLRAGAGPAAQAGGAMNHGGRRSSAGL